MTGKIILKGVRKAFGEHVIIPSIDLEIDEGEFVVFVGPSGCGKSTLLRLIAGLEDATGGRIEIDTLDDKIVVLNSGSIEQTGTPLELYHHPVNLFVAGFIGSPKMNFFVTEVRAAGPEGVTVGLPGGQAVVAPVAANGIWPGAKATLG